jgi:uncharacterized protein GlcG (DUF336 family)
MLSLRDARRIADALERGVATRSPVALAVCDPGGQLRLLATEDGCARLRPRLALRKAKTALALGFSTATIGRFSASSPEPVQALFRSYPRLLPIAGGVLFTHPSGELAGAAGVSGATPEEDDTIARIALSSAGFVPLDR